MFPVKRVAATAATCLGFAGLCTSCGYRSLNGSHDAPESRLAISAAPLRVSEPFALEAALAGARSELGRAGALKSSGYPRLVVELVRVDEVSAGVQAIGGQPLAGGTRIAVVARGWVEPASGAPPERDTGDLTRVEGMATTTAAEDAQRRVAAVRGAAREAGRAIGRRVLGEPEPATD